MHGERARARAGSNVEINRGLAVTAKRCATYKKCTEPMSWLTAGEDMSYDECVWMRESNYDVDVLG